MPTISNDYKRCEMLDLGSAPDGRGPCFIRQEGLLPGSMTLEQARFPQRHDGVRVLDHCVLSLPGKEQDAFLCATSADVTRALEKLTGDPVVDERLPEGKSKAEILAGIGATASRLLIGLRNARTALVS